MGVHKPCDLSRHSPDLHFMPGYSFLVCVIDLCNNEALSLASEAFEQACKKGTAKKPKKTICKQTKDVAWLLARWACRITKLRP